MFWVLPIVIGPSWTFHNLNYSCFSLCQERLDYNFQRRIDGYLGSSTYEGRSEVR